MGSFVGVIVGFGSFSYELAYPVFGEENLFARVDAENGEAMCVALLRMTWETECSVRIAASAFAAHCFCW